MRLEKDMILYHGSFCVVETPSLERCAKFKDFGRGFYLTTSINQARSFSKISASRARSKGFISANEMNAFVSCFKV